MTNLGMGAILGTKLEDFDHFGEGDLPRDGDHPKNGDHHRDGDHPRVMAVLGIFTILRDGYIIFGPRFSPKINI